MNAALETSPSFLKAGLGVSRINLMRTRNTAKQALGAPSASKKARNAMLGYRLPIPFLELEMTHDSAASINRSLPSRRQALKPNSQKNVMFNWRKREQNECRLIE